MVNPETVLARATAKGGQYEAYVGGGVTQFTSAEVGFALAGAMRKDGTAEPLPEGAVRILLLRYAGGDSTDQSILVRELVHDNGKQMDWVQRAATTLVCRLAVDEFLQSRRCSRCEGRLTVMDGDLVAPCPSCGQTGYEPYSAATRSHFLGIPVRTFRKGPAERMYLDRMKRLAQWEQAGLASVARKVR